ncbi:MAG: ferrous iron transport protein B [Erysipelotrichaceae bacterium]|nr:ferrous iron transport protein B [Erysipelotrichaceae bacterium]
MYKIALAGNPNCGKTTLFNALTGSHQRIGNWPGVTVEKKEGRWKDQTDIAVIDLPGIYSLSSYSLDERIARDYLLDEQPDLIVNVVDGMNLERNLYLTTQLQESGIPIIIALNMIDLVQAKKEHIDVDRLSQKLHCPIVAISALKNEGLEELLRQVRMQVAQQKHKLYSLYQGAVKTTLDQIMTCLEAQCAPAQRLWFAVQYLEQGGEIIEGMQLSEDTKIQLSAMRNQLTESLEDDGESIIATERYRFIAGVLADTYHKTNDGLSISDRIDLIVTNRWLALPIFALIMIAIYALAVTGIGGMATDWVNDVLFGEVILPATEHFLYSVQCAQWLSSLILNGVVAGVGAVLGFVPQMLVLFFFLALLEDVGYMARIAFLLDRLFRKFNLSGKAFIPMLIATGCGVPGIMASRTIEQETERRMTIITTTFIPCSAKLPIIALIAGALFDGAWWVAPCSYFIGMAAIILSGILLKKTRWFASDTTPFVMELPPYHMPKASNILLSMWERGYSFIKKAGTIILLSSIVIWFLSSFGIENGALVMLEASELNKSFLAFLGTLLSLLFVPLGWGSWEASVAAVSGLIAKENVVSTLAILFGVGEVAEDGIEIWGSFAAHFTGAAGLSFLVFNLLCAPCFAAIGAIKREMNNFKWTLFAIFYQCVVAYVASFMIYQFACLIESAQITLGSITAVFLFGMILYLLLRKKRTMLAKKER